MFTVSQSFTRRAKVRISRVFWQSEQCKQNISKRECNPSRGNRCQRKEADRTELPVCGKQPEESLQSISRCEEREITGASKRRLGKIAGHLGIPKGPKSEFAEHQTKTARPNVWRRAVFVFK